MKNVLFICIAAFFAALILFVQKQEMSVFTSLKEPVALSKVNTDKKQLALTFDSNWGDEQIQLILEALKDENVKATFFLSGEWAERHQEIVGEAREDGHDIQSHGMRHEDYTQLESSEIRRDILYANEAIYKASGERPVMMRPPYGKTNKEVLQTISRLNQQPVLWDVNPQDETNPGYKEIVRRVLEKAGKGSIIRLHASDSAKETYKALPLIIRELENKGYKFVTVKTLISDAAVDQNQLE